MYATLVIDGSALVTIRAYADASFVSGLDDRKSTNGNGYGKLSRDLDFPRNLHYVI